MSEWAGLVEAAAWPAVVVIALLLFRKPLLEVLANAKVVRLAGQQIEITRQQVDALSALMPQFGTGVVAPLNEPDQRSRRRISDRAATDANAALGDLHDELLSRIDEFALTNNYVAEVSGGPNMLGTNSSNSIAEISPEALPPLVMFAQLDEAIRTGRLELTRHDGLRLPGFGLQIFDYVHGASLRDNIVVASDIPPSTMTANARIGGATLTACCCASKSRVTPAMRSCCHATLRSFRPRKCRLPTTMTSRGAPVGGSISVPAECRRFGPTERTLSSALRSTDPHRWTRAGSANAGYSTVSVN